MSDILKLCANCGATDPHDGIRGQAPAAHRRITCVHCGMTAPSVEAWNRRVQSPAVKALVDAAKEMMTSHYVSSHKKIEEIREVLRAAMARVKAESYEQ
jgi:hypothetical protein